MMRSLTAGLRTLFRRRDVERELSDELTHYVEEATRDNMRAGMPAAEAERAARARLGSATSAREEALSAGWEAGIDSLMKDIRFGVRAAIRKPGFTIAAIATIALGIGATTSMFSVVNAVILRPLPWRNAHKLALIWTDDARRGLHREGTAYTTITDWQQSNQTFSSIAYFSTQRVAPMSNERGGERGRSRSALVSAGFFSVLGVAPIKGRVIGEADVRDRAPVAVISHGFWQRWFAGAPDIIGKTLVVDDASKGPVASVTVVGVMPPDFYFPDQLTEIWTPATTYWRFARESSERFPSWARRWTGIGRIKDGLSVQDAGADLDRVGSHLASIHPSSEPDFPGFGTTILSVLDSITGQSLQSTLWVLLGAVSLVLLIACVNVAHLLLARGAARQHEFALRRALGAGRIRIARQLLVESLVLATGGGIVGTLLALWGTRILGTAAAGFVPRISEIVIDWRVMTFAALATMIAGIAFGLAPALRLAASDAAESLRSGRRDTGAKRFHRSRNMLVIAECALALTLLAGAGLLLRSLARMQAVDPGFDPSNVLAARIEFPTEAPASAEERTQTSQIAPARARARVALASELARQVKTLPGVAATGFVDDLFLSGQGNESITIRGRSSDEIGAGELNAAALSGDFFGVMRVPLVRGRLLTAEDTEQRIHATWSGVQTDLPLAEKERRATPEPVLVNQAFVRRFFPNEDPIGRKFCIDPTNKTYWYQIVGVIGDMHRQGLEHQMIPEYFGPWMPGPNGRVDLVVRTTADPLLLAPAIRDAIRRVVPGSTVVSVSSAESLLGGFSALRRLQTWLLTIFALLAVTLAGIGVFGLVHFAVSERTREIGVRMALGATPGAVLGQLLREGLRAPAIGIGVGLATSIAVTRVLSSMLFGVGPTDLATFAAVVGVLAFAATAACWLAGRRALRVDPALTLKE